MREGVIDNRKLTPYRGLDEVLIDYAHTSRAVLGDNFIGLYLLGSLAIGDFDLTSDVDFMIVTNSELSRDQVELVQSAHTKLIARDSRWVRHLEYSIFPRQKLSEKSSPYGPNGRDDSAARQLPSGRGTSRSEGADYCRRTCPETGSLAKRPAEVESPSNRLRATAPIQVAGPDVSPNLHRTRSRAPGGTEPPLCCRNRRSSSLAS